MFSNTSSRAAGLLSYGKAARPPTFTALISLITLLAKFSCKTDSVFFVEPYVFHHRYEWEKWEMDWTITFSGAIMMGNIVRRREIGVDE